MVEELESPWRVPNLRRTRYNDSYIIVYEDKHVTWDLKGCYEGLDKRLSQVLATSTKLFYVALNPYHDEYFCEFDDWSCTFNFPGTEDFKIVENLIFESNLRVIVDSETLRQSTDAVPVPEMSTNGKEKDGIAKTVMEKAMTNLAEKNLENMLENL